MPDRECLLSKETVIQIAAAAPAISRAWRHSTLVPLGRGRPHSLVHPFLVSNKLKLHLAIRRVGGFTPGQCCQRADTKKPDEAVNPIRQIEMLENQRRAFVRRRSSKPLETRATVESIDVGSGIADMLIVMLVGSKATLLSDTSVI